MSRRLRHAAGALCVVGGATLMVGWQSLPAGAAGPAPGTAVGTVVVQTVPALPGVHFSLGSASGVTGADGSAQIPNQLLDTAEQHLVVPGQQLNNGLRVSLDRVVNAPDHPVFQRVLLVDLDEDRAVSFVVDTPEGVALPAAQVTSITVQDSLGRTLKITGKQLTAPVWLASRQSAPDPTAVASRDVVYTVTSVVVRGSNIVNAGRLHFEPEQTDTWKIPGIFFNLVVQGDDLLGGRPAGASVRLVYPDRSVVQVPLRAHHRVTLTDLPRGNYSLQVRGGLIPLSSQVRLSRDQVVTQLVVTGSDVLVMGLVAFGLIALLAGIGAVGRHLRLARRRQMELNGAPA